MSAPSQAQARDGASSAVQQLELQACAPRNPVRMILPPTPTQNEASSRTSRDTATPATPAAAPASSSSATSTPARGGEEEDLDLDLDDESKESECLRSRAGRHHGQGGQGQGSPGGQGERLEALAEHGEHLALVRLPPEQCESGSAREARIARHVSLGVWLSLAVNVALFGAKTYAAISAKSLSVAASAVDSFLDLASQGIVFLAERGSKSHDVALYPAGRSRLEPVGIILCAALMAAAALQLIQESCTQLAEGYTSDSTPQVHFTVGTLVLLCLTIGVKFVLWLYCAAFRAHSPALHALAADHRNDVFSNAVALVAAILAWQHSAAWSADPIGAIVMSLYIVANWFDIGREQVEMIVGRAAEPEFIDSVRALATDFHPQLVPDLIRAYHFGAKYLVELEVVLPAEMTVREAHDISLALQQSVEQLAAVERAFVHVDYMARGGEDEHDAEVIAEKIKAALASSGGSVAPATPLAITTQE